MCLMGLSSQAAEYQVSSPNGKVKVVVNTDEAVKWSVSYGGKPVLMPSQIDIQLWQGKKSLGLGQIGKVAVRQIKSSFDSPFYKKATVKDEYGQMLMYTNQKFTIEVRAYDDGAAYRLISANSKPSTVVNETAEFCFDADSGSATVTALNRITTSSRCRRCLTTRWPLRRWPSVCLAA